MSELSIAVVTPTLNEEANLPKLLESLSKQTRRADRIVVADGGSTDATISIAESAGVEVLRDLERGRGNQISAVVEAAREDVVFIAHADMVLPAAALDRVDRWMCDHPDCPGGCIGHRFAERNWSLRLVEWGDWLRVRWTGRSYGDQGQFFRRAVIKGLGGFPRQPLFEDLELARMLARSGRAVCLDVPAVVSARALLRNGVWKAVAENARLRREYRTRGNAAAARLYALYYARAMEVTSPASAPSSSVDRS